VVNLFYLSCDGVFTRFHQKSPPNIEQVHENETKEILTSRLDFERLLRRKIFLQTKESKVALEIKEDEDLRLLSEDYHDIIINQTKVEYLTTKSKGIDSFYFHQYTTDLVIKIIGLNYIIRIFNLKICCLY